jgi:OOP family OmpA-OmpF porin
MSKITLATIAVACLALQAAPVAAEHEPALPYYLGFGLAFASADSDCDYYGYNCDGTDTGFKFYGGKRLHENLAVEIAFLDLGKLRDKAFESTTVAESQGINFSILGIIPTGDIGYLYGKAGVMASESTITRSDASGTRKNDEDSTDFTYGAGYAVTFGGKYDLRFELERLNDLSDDFVPGGDAITSFTIGGTIHFD